MQRDAWELAILDATHETVPRTGRPAAGVFINLEVEDADAEYQRLVSDGPLEALLPLRSEAFGQRHFIVAGPDDVLIEANVQGRPSTLVCTRSADDADAVAQFLAAARRCGRSTTSSARRGRTAPRDPTISAITRAVRLIFGSRKGDRGRTR